MSFCGQAAVTHHVVTECWRNPAPHMVRAGRNALACEHPYRAMHSLSVIASSQRNTWRAASAPQRALSTASWGGCARCSACTTSQEHLLSWMSVPILPITAGSPKQSR